MAVRDWLNTAIAYVREQARSMRDPVDWHPTSFGKPDYPPDRHGNHTVRTRQEITTLQATDASGREWTILEIIPIEPIQGYDRMHFTHGRARYELKDGTPVIQHSDTTFEVSGNKLTVARNAGTKLDP